MNSKNALILSATLTAFVLAILFGVVTKVTNSTAQATVAPVVQVAQVENTAVPTDVPATDLPAPTAQAILSPDQAAALAAKAINRQDVYSVESYQYKGIESFKVVFSSGDVVYIGMDQLVLEKTKLKPAVVAVAEPTKPAKKKYNGGGGSSQSSSKSSSSSGSEHENEHENESEHEGN